MNVICTPTCTNSHTEFAHLNDRTFGKIKSITKSDQLHSGRLQSTENQICLKSNPNPETDKQ